MGERNTDFSLVFRAGARLCALSLQHVLETLRPLPTEPLEGAPAYVLGLSLIRGSALPVVDVARLLGERDAEIKRYVTIAVGERRVALAVGQVQGLQALPAASLQDLPPLMRHADQEVVTSLAELDAQLLLVLDGSRLLPDLAAPADTGTGVAVAPQGAS